MGFQRQRLEDHFSCAPVNKSSKPIPPELSSAYPAAAKHLRTPVLHTPQDHCRQQGQPQEMSLAGCGALPPMQQGCIAGLFGENLYQYIGILSPAQRLCDCVGHHAHCRLANHADGMKFVAHLTCNGEHPVNRRHVPELDEGMPLCDALCWQEYGCLHIAVYQLSSDACWLILQMLPCSPYAPLFLMA
jgi:hypothetical protein